MTSEHALILLISMYVGSISGGLISATLLRIPGTPASMMTTLDGHPMASGGQPERALSLGVSASLVGGIISWLILILLSRPLATLSLTFGPWEFFALVLMALALIASVSGESLSGDLMAAFLGILVAMPGSSPATGMTRWTFGMYELDDGFKLLPVLIGLFAVNQVIAEILNLNRRVDRIQVSHTGFFLPLSIWVKHARNLVRSSLIGTIIGILPGVGANIGSVVAYSAARSSSKSPEQFGNGSEEGIVASEAANNATVGGALVPLIAMGIPGSVIDAILLGALIIHGLQPGPLLFDQSPGVVYVIMSTMLIANVFMYLFMTLSVRWLAKLAIIPRPLLLPTILTFCVIGSYALANRFFDVWVMLAFGVIGYLMERSQLPLAPFVIGFVLAPIAEEHLTEGLMHSNGDWSPLITRPISATFTAFAVASIVYLFYRHRSRVTARL